MMQTANEETKKHNLTLQAYISALRSKGILADGEASKVASGEIESRAVKYISYDSQDVRPDTLFVCKGKAFKPEYLEAAIAGGAFAYVSEIDYNDSLSENTSSFCVLVSDIRKAMTCIADLYYDSPQKKLTLVGITGTKGKSTTTYYTKAVIDEYLKKIGKPESAILSGIDNYDGVIREESHLTTPETFSLYEHFYNAATSGIEFLSMEVSSQALKYHRTLDIQYNIGCFLNLGQDHISEAEHQDFEDYKEAKLKLMEQCHTACINMDDPQGQVFLDRAKKHCQKVITFGRSEGVDVRGYNIKGGPEGVKFKAKSTNFDKEFSLSMGGLFNVTNALATIAMTTALGISPDCIYDGLKDAKVSGRMEVYHCPRKNFTVIVDYAHNKMSFEALFKSTMEEYPGKNMTIVFGCPGKKAFARRQELGELAGQYCSSVFITEEDAGEEPLSQISLEIAEHVKKYPCSCEIIDDRGLAIRKALEQADENTVVLLTGKGRETRQKRGRLYVDTPSDVEYVEAFLKEDFS